MAPRDQVTGGWPARWPTRRSTQRLIARVETARSRRSLHRLVRIACDPRRDAGPLARAALDSLCGDDRAVLATLALSWSEGRFTGAAGDFVLSLLLAPKPVEWSASPGRPRPRPRLVELLDSGPAVPVLGRPAGTVEGLGDTVGSALARGLAELGGTSRAPLMALLSTTDHPVLLDQLVRFWLVRGWAATSGNLVHAIRANPNLPRQGEHPRVVIVTERLELLDTEHPEAVDALLDGVATLPSPGAREACRRALAQLPPGWQRERLCRAARTSAEALAVVRAAGWYPADVEERLLFQFLTGDLRSYAKLDPYGVGLRDAYRRADPLVQFEIRKVLGDLEIARKRWSTTSGLWVGGTAASPSWPWHVTFDLAAFAGDVGCGAGPGSGAGHRGHRRRSAFGGGGFVGGGSCGGGGGSCGGGGGGCGGGGCGGGGG